MMQEEFHRQEAKWTIRSTLFSLVIAALTLALLAIPRCGSSQPVVQIHGIFYGADTVKITAWSDGEEIISRTVADPVYSLVLGERPHYTVRFQSRDQVKYCHVFTFQMGVESIAVDIDFRTAESAIVTKASRTRAEFEFAIYGVRGWRTFRHDYRKIAR